MDKRTKQGKAAAKRAAKKPVVHLTSSGSVVFSWGDAGVQLEVSASPDGLRGVIVREKTYRMLVIVPEAANVVRVAATDDVRPGTVV